MSLPGIERYGRSSRVELDKDAPWNHPLVLKANEEIRIEDILNQHFGMSVPYDADRWKTRCPYAHEHADGGLDKQFRIYSSHNYAYCFESHGHLDPVRLWRMRIFAPSLLDAAKDLLKTYGVETRRKTYTERIEELLAEKERPHTDPSAVIQALQVFLTTVPGYEDRQYDDDVLRSVNLLLEQIPVVCEDSGSQEEVEQWLRYAKSELVAMISP